MPSVTRTAFQPLAGGVGYTLGAADAWIPEAVTAEWDGSGASSDFVVAVSFYNVGGALIDRAWPSGVTNQPGDAGRTFFRPFNRAGADSGAGAGIGNVIPFAVSGALLVATGNLRWYATAAGTISEVHASVGTAPTGSGVTVQVNRNGSSIGTVTIGAGNNTNTFVPGSSSYNAGDFFTVDVTAIGSTIAGADLVAQIRSS